MQVRERSKSSRYLEWAKLNSPAKYNLATSGIQGYPLSALPFTVADLEINGPDAYGYKPLQERLASLCGVDRQSVVAANGTSMANHLAMAAVLDPGDTVLIERPTYGLFLDVASYLGAKIERFDRRVEDAFQIDIDALRKAVTPHTKLIVITNMHNPTGALTDEKTLIAVGEIAANVGAYVIVDEVYLPLVLDPPQRTCFHLGDRFIVTTSLTKGYGLSGLRCGWILAEPDLARHIWRLSDLFTGSPVHPAELLSVIALNHLEQIAARANGLIASNRPRLDAFLNSSEAIEVVRPQWGTIVFPKLKHGTVAEFAAFLRSEFDTSIVPGDFFEMPQHFRIGIGGDPAMTAEGLVRLHSALEAYVAGK